MLDGLVVAALAEPSRVIEIAGCDALPISTINQSIKLFHSELCDRSSQQWCTFYTSTIHQDISFCDRECATINK
jgi:hypothetical protein